MILKNTTTYFTVDNITNEKVNNIKLVSNSVKIVLLNEVTIYRKTTDNNTRILTNIVNSYLEL